MSGSGTGITTRYDGVGITNGGISTKKSKPKARKKKCKTKKRKGKGNTAAAAAAPAPAPAARLGLGGFRLAGAQANISDLSGNGATRFNIANDEIQTVMNDNDLGGYQVRVEGGQFAGGNGVKSFGIDVADGEVQVCCDGKIQFVDQTSGQVNWLGNVNDAGEMAERVLPNGVKISTKLINGQEKIVVEGNEYRTEAAAIKDGDCTRYDLDVKEKGINVANNATGIAPAFNFLNLDQLF
jgi:hypothetical protein